MAREERFMGKVNFKLEKRPDENTGVEVDTLIKCEISAEGTEMEETWGNVTEFNQLFDTCVARWGSNWDLNKVMTAIRESDIS